MTTGTEISTVRAGGGDQSLVRFEQTMTMVREALLNPNLAPENAKVMAELLNNQEDRMQAAEFNRDFNAALREMPVITKAGIITIPAKDGKAERTQGRFARFEDIDRVVRPILDRHNIAIRFEVGEANGAVTVRPILSHANGHTERGEAMRLPIDSSGAKNNVQGSGSAVTYGKRYTMCGILNIITEGTDDDGSLGKLAIDMTHERQVTVLEQAEEAFAQDRYSEWFNGQGVKDRSWLVSSGHHARLGGSTLALSNQVAAPPPSPPPPAQDRRSAAPAGDKPDVTTAEGWTKQYELDCAATRTEDELATVKAKGKNALARLSNENTKLWERCDAAEVEARDRIKNTAPADGGLFGGKE